MAAFALGILGVLVFLLAGTNTFFKSTSDIYTYFDDSAAIAVAAQDWCHWFEDKLRNNPQDWLFWLDKRWSQFLRTTPRQSQIS